MATTWTCRRVTRGVVCGAKNPGRIRICRICLKARPKKKYPSHKKALTDFNYEEYIKFNGGEFCWIHKALNLPEPVRTRRLHRDHDHITGKPRGLLCATCNRAIKTWMSAEWMEAAAKYLRKFS